MMLLQQQRGVSLTQAGSSRSSGVAAAAAPRQQQRQQRRRSAAPTAAAASMLAQQCSSSSCSSSIIKQRGLPLLPPGGAARRPARPSRAAAAGAAAASADFRSRPPSEVSVLVVGPTGYIGRFVTRELIARGYRVTALAREKAGIKGKMGREDTVKEFPGATVVFGDVSDPESIRRAAFASSPDGAPFDVVVSCLASRTGGKKDSWAVDYQATKNVLDVARARGAAHFVLLSAICVQKPLLEFQRAKLKLEAELQAASSDTLNPVSYSIVRPTAFFKSLAGQIQLVKEGKPYVMFGDGKLAACKPISEADLARFIADCVQSPDRANRVLPVGGPGGAVTAKDQADMLFRLANVPPKYFPVPIALMDGIIGIFDLLARVFPALEDSAEFGRIGRYYAAESMLVWDEARQRYDADATPEYGQDTLEGFFERALRDGLAGQELGDQAVFGVGE